MGCGLRKLEDPEDSSPGKIYSTLKRPQVETKTETVYEYVLLDFSLEGSRPTVQYVASLSELPQALQPYYTQGYVLTALHPIILSVGRTRSLPFSLLYRAILARPRSSKQMASMCYSVPMLKVEEWPLPGESLTGDTVRALIDRVNSSARGGVRFVGSVLQQVSGITNGRVHSPKRSCRSPPRTPPRTPPGDRELEENTYSPDLRLLVFFHSWAPGCAPLDSLACQYHQGALSMRVSRKGQVVSSLEADWLELTAAYYCKGWSLVDSFVYWDTPKGEPVPRSLEGLFVYEERSTSPPANDTIVVEQWTVIEGTNVKTDYGPLLHTLAEFGWLLTCVLPTPIIRHDSDGNLATKQVVFLQRPVRGQASSGQTRNQVLLLHSDVSSRSVSRAVSSPIPPEEELSPTAGGIGGFPVFGGGYPSGGYPSALSHLEEGGFEQEEGKAEVTCM
ncbi:raftlin-2 [Anarhichas minor]|uniref:raftlin-2 n=1 Tax=Anarhichas minor TaxID=65739 RepID=UPI003F736215